MTTQVKLIVLSPSGPVAFANVAKVNASGLVIGGTVTDFNGHAFVQAEQCYKISAIGYETKEFCVGPVGEDIYIEMQDKVYELAGVTITPPSAKTSVYAVAAIILFAIILFAIFRFKK